MDFPKSMFGVGNNFNTFLITLQITFHLVYEQKKIEMNTQN